MTSLVWIGFAIGVIIGIIIKIVLGKIFKFVDGAMIIDDLDPDVSRWTIRYDKDLDTLISSDTITLQVIIKK